MESLRNTVVCREHDIAEYVPDPPEGLLGFDEAVRLAVQRVQDSAVATRWASASVPGAPSDPLPTDPDWAGGSLYVDERTRATAADAGRAVAGGRGHRRRRRLVLVPARLGVRGWLDRLVGGVGLRRGRRDPRRLYVGDALDFWRVEEIEEGRLLRLRAEMRLPGLAWLEFHVEHGESRTGAGHGAAAAGDLRAARAGRAPVLVGGRGVPRHRLRRHDPRHHPPGGERNSRVGLTSGPEGSARRVEWGSAQQGDGN